MFIKRILDSEKDSSIKIIGIGDVGNNIVIKMNKSGCKYHTIAINPEMRDAIGIPDTKLIVGIKTNKGLGCGTNRSLAEACFEESIEEINSILTDNSHSITKEYIIVRSLSSTNFSVGIKYLTSIINKLNDKKIYVVASDSTNYENDVRKEIKDTCLSMLDDYKNKNCIDDVIIVNYLKKDETNIEYYEKLNSKMIEKIENLITRKELDNTK